MGGRKKRWGRKTEMWGRRRFKSDKYGRKDVE